VARRTGLYTPPMARELEGDLSTATVDRRPAWLFPIAVTAGAGIGLYSVLADGILPGRVFLILGNMAAPWGLVAFLVGRQTTSYRRGAAAGGVTLVVAVLVYYVGTAIRGFVFAGQTVAWTVVALRAGPVMGLCGAATAARRSRPPIVAVVLPSAMLLAEALYQLDTWKTWRWNLEAERYRLIEAGVALALVVGGLLLPFLLVKDRRDRRIATLLVPVAGIAGAAGLVLLGRLIIGVT
jgi:hypothetical protein